MPPRRKRARDGTVLAASQPAEFDGLAEALDRLDVKALAQFLSLQIGWKAVRRGISARDGRFGWIAHYTESSRPKLSRLLCAVIREGDVTGAATIGTVMRGCNLSFAEGRGIWNAFCESHPPGMCTAIQDALSFFPRVETREHGTHMCSPAFPCCGKVFPEYVGKEVFRAVRRMARLGDTWMARYSIEMYIVHGRPDLAAQIPNLSWRYYAPSIMYSLCRAGLCDVYYECIIRPRMGRRMRILSCLGTQTRTWTRTAALVRALTVICTHVEKSFARLQAHGMLESQEDVQIAMERVEELDGTPERKQTCLMMELLCAAHKGPSLAALSHKEVFRMPTALFCERRRAELVTLLAVHLPLQNLPEAIADLVHISFS
mgnify:FL=1